MRTILAIALAITLVSAGAASAQVVDMNTVTCNDFNGLPAQPVDATQALNLSAGVSNPKVLRGRSLS
jgi:hypothetical protein